MFKMWAIYFDTCFLNTLCKVGHWISLVIWLFNSSISAGLVRNTRFSKKDRRKISKSVRSGLLAGRQPSEIKSFSRNSFKEPSLFTLNECMVGPFPRKPPPPSGAEGRKWPNNLCLICAWRSQNLCLYLPLALSISVLGLEKCLPPSSWVGIWKLDA